MDPNLIVTALVTLISSAAGFGTIHWRLARLEKLVDAQALERVENHLRVSQIELRVSALEDAA